MTLITVRKKSGLGVCEGGGTSRRCVVQSAVVCTCVYVPPFGGVCLCGVGVLCICVRE